MTGIPITNDEASRKALRIINKLAEQLERRYTAYTKEELEHISTAYNELNKLRK